MPVCWGSLLRHLTRHSYLAADASSGRAGSLGPLGRLLLRNLTAVWRRDVELGLGVAVVPAPLPAGWLSAPSPPLTAAISDLTAVRTSLGLSPPFGVCSELPVTGQLTAPDQLTAPSADADQLTAPPADGGRLSLLLAVPAASSVDWFQTLQRRRRIWWRELAEDPGNYSLAPVGIDGAEVVFDDRLVVERLRRHGPVTGGDEKDEPSLLSCEVCLQSALFAVCGDALDGGALRLQERLAPYGRAVLSHPGWAEERRALAAHISGQLRAAGVTVFPLSGDSLGAGNDSPSPAGETDDADLTEEGRWQAAALEQADGAGVPLTVLVSESTLRDGVCHLRSRDTTLSHQTHVSQLTDVR